MTRNEIGFIGFISFLVLMAVAVGVLVYYFVRPEREEVVEEPTYVEKVFKTQTSQFRVMIDTVEVEGQVYVVAISSTGLSIIPYASCNCIER